MRIFLSAFAVFVLTATSAFGWGTDIPIWTGGDVNCFDVDYAMDGTMYAGFQAQGETIIRVYRSTDHGASWNQWTTLATSDASYGTSQRSDLSRIRILYDEPNNQLLVFYVDSDGYLSRWRVKTDLSAKVNWRVSSSPVLEGSFDVTWDNKSSGRTLYAFWSEGTSAGAGVYLKSTTSSYPVESSWSDIVSGAWNCDAETRGSLAFGPPDNLFWAYSYKYGSGSCESDSEIWMNIFFRLTDNTYRDYDPRVAAANANESGVWVMYNRDRGGHEIDLHFRYSPDGGITWNASEYTVSADNGVDEYISDIKFYKGFPNAYVDMVYIYDDPSGTPVRKAVWVWTSTGDPTNWKGETVVNDEDVTPWPEDVAPRIVYSPGAPASGGGVVFSYYGRNGLYFDAPWIKTLTVTVNGSGKVESAPAGIDCTGNAISGTKTCSAGFVMNTAVALTETPIDGTDYTSHFIGWSGDCSGSGGCAVNMDADKAVTADFGALGIPVYVLPLPTGEDVYNYLPVVNPVENPDTALCKPFAVGDVAGGTLSLKVGLHQFAGNIDIYLALYVPDIDPDNVYLITSGEGIQPVSDGLVPWKANTSGDINESIFGDIPVSGLPSGTYTLGLMVTPAGNTSVYYLWITYFVVP
ncbi:MAG TPA: hypothetical protein ENH30_03155 [Nitrospirae bacterium]|nr:hypothetical protein [Nitrospirota bacterium]